MANKTTKKSAKVAKKAAAKLVPAKAAKPRKAVAKSSAHLGDEFLDVVDRFVTEAELFAQWATAGTGDVGVVALGMADRDCKRGKWSGGEFAICDLQVRATPVFPRA
jgi:hypothetical protein